MVNVLAVKPLKNKIRIVLENDRDYVLSRHDLRLFPLAEGQQVDESELARFVFERQFPAAMSIAVAQLTRRVCSRMEVTRKLVSACFEPEVIEKVVQKLEKDRFIDDRRFTESWIHYRSGMHYGPDRIRRELLMKGVSEKIVHDAFDRADPAGFENTAVHEAEKLLRRCRGDIPSFPELQKATASLVRKGFSWDTAKSAVREAAQRIKEHREPV